VDAVDYIARYYQNYDEDGRLGTRHGMVEFLTTMRYIERYIKPGMKVIEIGAGTGRYSHALAHRGFHVDAVELVEHNIGIFKGHMTQGERVTICQGNATDLSAFGDESYDITLLLGPMYHLFEREEQLKALSEALRVTKKGGIVYAAYCAMDASILGHGFIRGHIHEILEKCMLDLKTFTASSNPWDIFELYRKEDIDGLMENFAARRLHYVASDGYANHMRETLANMDEKTFDLFMKYHFVTCERGDMVGLSHHVLDIFKKE
jgi:ubiquinone/menaquinone biosynthesis C-methylase UbiE